MSHARNNAANPSDSEDNHNNNNNSDRTDNSSQQDTAPSIDALSQYLKAAADTRQARAIPPLEQWHPKQIADMDLLIKANGEWWHDGSKVTRQSLVDLFATILWQEELNGAVMYYLKTPVQKLRIKVEDVPLLINDVGIVQEGGVSWLEFTTSTGDVVRLDDEHAIELRTYQSKRTTDAVGNEAQVRPYMLVRNGLYALIGRNTFYHLTEIGELTQQNERTVLTLRSGGKLYDVPMPTE